MVKLFLVAAAFGLILLAGCLQTRNPDDCEKITDTFWSSEKMSCYHEVAMGFAVSGDNGNAVLYCGKIEPTVNAFSLSERNTCFTEIAEALSNRSICGLIEDTSITGDLLTPLRDYKQMCVDKATPKDYTINFCASPFILASLLLAVLVGRKK
ncbi:MAG: hypothetical protein PHS02_04345 [Candidatus ainarchaeum sp.]|nr:hypothetical protein [Candidatus ainarchaeum sp.]